MRLRSFWPWLMAGFNPSIHFEISTGESVVFSLWRCSTYSAFPPWELPLQGRSLAKRISRR